MDLTNLVNSAHFGLAVYAILFFGMFLEANLTTMASAFLITHKILHPGLVVLAVVGGAFSEQYGLYFAGWYLGNRQRLAGYINKHAARYDRHFTEKIFRSLLISKYVYGLHRAVLLRAGMLKVPVGTFTRATLRSTAIWLASFFTLGLIFSASYNTIKHYISYGEISLLIIVIIFFILEYLISRRFRKDI